MSNRQERRAEAARNRKRMKNGRDYWIHLDTAAAMPIECQTIRAINKMPDNATGLRFNDLDDETHERAYRVLDLMLRLDSDDDARAELEAIGKALGVHGYAMFRQMMAG